MTNHSNCNPKQSTFATGTEHVRLYDLPEDVLLRICDFIHHDALPALSQISTHWAEFCVQKVWPRHLAAKVGVRGIRFPLTTRVASSSAVPAQAYQKTHIPSAREWTRLLHTVSLHEASRTLCIFIQLSPSDSVNSLALEYSISRDDIFRTNALFSENHVASRTHLYIPLFTEEAVLRFTGLPTQRHIPTLMRDKHLSSKYFLVVKTLPSAHAKSGTTATPSRRESYVRQLVVKLIAKGLSFHEDEVRFYLDDNNFDVAKAYKQLLSDHALYP